MKERGMIFNGDMVRAILEGRKTVTRRPVKDSSGYTKVSKCASPYDEFILIKEGKIPGSGSGIKIKSPHGTIGDRLYVRETMYVDGYLDVHYSADHVIAECEELADWDYREPEYVGSIPSIHMPKFAARIWLEITDVRVERVQDINPSEVLSEGIRIEVPRGIDPSPFPDDFSHWSEEKREAWIDSQARATYLTRCNYESGLIDAFRSLWDSIYENWKENPWVWVIEFKRIDR